MEQSKDLSNKFVCSMQNITAEHKRSVGNKAYNLSLVEQYVTVPYFIVLTTECYQEYFTRIVKDANLSLEEIFPGELKETLHASYIKVSKNGNFPVAARSSSNIEDLNTYSFAGLYESILNITSYQKMLEAIKSVWLSSAKDAVKIYGADIEAMPADLGMAVIIQQQINSSTSGVLFTCNPVTDSDSEMLVEATNGLANRLVDGLVRPESYWFNSINLELISGPEKDAPANENQLKNIVKAGQLIQIKFGYPVDIEWATDGNESWVLQVRPITNIQFTKNFGQWTSANFREIMPNQATPMSYSLLEYDFTASMDYFLGKLLKSGVTQGEWTKYIFGRAYWNVGKIKQILNQHMPGFNERIFDESIGVAAGHDLEKSGDKTDWRLIVKATPIAFKLICFYMVSTVRAKKYCKKFVRDFSLIKESLKNIKGISDAADILRRAIELRQKINHHALLITLLAKQLQDDLAKLVDTLNSFAGGPLLDLNSLLRQNVEYGTVQPMNEIASLIAQIKRSRGVAALILNHSYSEFVEAAKNDQKLNSWWQNFNEYIEKYYYLSDADEELINERLDENPSILYEAIKVHLKNHQQIDHIHPTNKINKLSRMSTIKNLRARLKAYLIYPLLTFFLLLTRHYIFWREELRVYLSRAHYITRKTLVCAGNHLADAALLEKNDDLFFLTWHQLESFLNAAALHESVSDIRKTIENNKRYLTMYRNYVANTNIGANNTRINSRAGEGEIKGLVCAQGKAKGRARIIRSLTDIKKLEKGDVLVTPFLNPGWVIAYNAVEAIVSEEGGILSHGALIAREKNIPTLLQVANATRVLRDGMLIEVDAEEGLVRFDCP